MTELTDKLMLLLGIGDFWRLPLLIGIYLFYALFCLVFGALFAGFASWYERRLAGRMQCRIGPNRVGPQGMWQWLCDGVKCFLKEDLVPANADKPLFLLAPYPVFIAVVSTFAVLPFAPSIVGGDLNVGIVYLIAITALVVIGILMAGWSSNNKYTLLGGIRSAAQMVSYEIPVALFLLVAVVDSGTLSLQQMVRLQGGAPYEWFICSSPFAFVAFFLYFISAIAEGNRAPFDLPEAESELVSGYNTEYSGLRFLLFFFAEWMNLYVIGAIATAVFLGGWRVPFVSLEAQTGNILWETFGFGLFFVKAIVLANVIMWVRWTLPRLRIDQLMQMCWKYFVPIGIISVIGTMGWVVLRTQVPVLDLVMRLCIFGLSMVILFYLGVRTRYAWRSFGEKPYFKWLV
jgi:NADH-quinone oxidoreductase subunit H